MKVSIYRCTPDPLETIVIAARRCYSADEIPGFDPNKSKAEFVKFLMSREHLTPFEFVNVVFHISGVSRVLSHQLVRTRIASYCQQSQRYCKGYPGHVVPKTIQESMFKGNHKLVDALLDYWEAFNLVQKELQDAGIPQEDSRYYWPEATETKIMVNLNCHSMMNFFKTRLDPHAQWEIREMANLMYEQISGILPEVFPMEKIKQ